MENAPKALIIAGSILITIMIISLGVVVFRRMSEPIQNDSSLSEAQVRAFNEKITPNTGEHVSGTKVNVLINHIYAVNSSKEYEGVQITFPIKDRSGNDTTNVLKKDGTFSKPNLAKKVETSSMYYKVTYTFNNNTGMINQITVVKE